MPQSKGFRRKTRSILKKRQKTRQGLSPFLRQYNIRDKVVININPAQVKGMPHRRFQGRVGVVEEVGRRALVVKVPIGGKEKKVIARLEHLKPHLKEKTK